MPYSYCPECDAELENPPSDRQVLENNFYCYCCGEDLGVSPDQHREAMSELLDRIEAIEAKLNIHP